MESYVCYVLLLIPSPSPKIPTTLNFLVGTTSTPPKVENRIIYTAPKGDDRQKNQKTYTIVIHHYNIYTINKCVYNMLRPTAIDATDSL